MLTPKELLKPAVTNSQAYQVADASGLIKLDAMENPYVWPEDIQQQWLECLKESSFNRYPSPNPENLKQQIREVLNVSNDQAMLLGNGSDELIQILLLALQPGSTVLSVEPSFVMYEIVSSWLDLDFQTVSLNTDFSVPEEAFLKNIKALNPALIFLAWPNNPTANLFPVTFLKKVLQASEGLVVIDEAYHAFAKQTMANQIENYPNLLVMRTFSKLGLAGLRFGFMLGSDEWINEFDKIRLPYNNNSLTQDTLSFILNHLDVLEAQADRMIQERDRMIKELQNSQDIEVWSSDANFFLFRLENKTADEVHASLKANGILIKNVSKAHPLLNNCLRVSIGKEEENALFIQAMRKLV